MCKTSQCVSRTLSLPINKRVVFDNQVHKVLSNNVHNSIVAMVNVATVNAATVNVTMVNVAMVNAAVVNVAMVNVDMVNVAMVNVAMVNVSMVKGNNWYEVHQNVHQVYNK